MIGVRISCERSERKSVRIFSWIERVLWRLFIVVMSGVNSLFHPYRIAPYRLRSMMFCMVVVIVPIGRNIERIQRKYPSNTSIIHTTFTKSIPLRIFVTKRHSILFSQKASRLNAGKRFFSLDDTGSDIIVSPLFHVFDMYNVGFFEIFSRESERFEISERIARYSA